MRGIGSATEADVKKLFPTCTAVVVRGTNHSRGKSHQHRFCFVVFATAAACTEALEKSKGELGDNGVWGGVVCIMLLCC